MNLTLMIMVEMEEKNDADHKSHQKTQSVWKKKTQSCARPLRKLCRIYRIQSVLWGYGSVSKYPVREGIGKQREGTTMPERLTRKNGSVHTVFLW